MDPNSRMAPCMYNVYKLESPMQVLFVYLDPQGELPKIQQRAERVHDLVTGVLNSSKVSTKYTLTV